MNIINLEGGLIAASIIVIAIIARGAGSVKKYLPRKFCVALMCASLIIAIASKDVIRDAALFISSFSAMVVVLYWFLKFTEKDEVTK
jgi:hypothetical protein